MPILSYKKKTKWQHILGDDITATIRTLVLAAGLLISFTKAEISARSLCAGGGMDLLLKRVDLYNTCLVGRWQSNTMLCYLHTTEKSFIEGLLAKMFEHGAYALILTAHTGN